MLPKRSPLSVPASFESKLYEVSWYSENTKLLQQQVWSSNGYLLKDLC